MTKRKLALAAVLAALGTGSMWMSSVSAAEKTNAHGGGTDSVDTYELPTLVVSGERMAEEMRDSFVAQGGSVGILGEKSAMETPFSTTHITQQTIAAFGDPTQPLDSVLSVSPSVRPTASILHNDFQLRGFRSNGSSSYVNGIPDMFTQFNAPLHVIEKVDVVSGPNSGLSGTGTQYESTAAGGIVNFTTKRAGDEDITRLTLTHSGKNLFGGYFDLARRFGRNRSWGARLNAEKVDGEMAVDKQRVKSESVYINIDRKGMHSKTNFFTGYRQNEIINGQRWFKLGDGVTRFPAAPKASRNYGFDGMDKESYGWLMTLNHEQQFSKDWKYFFNAGTMKNKLNQNVMYQRSAITILDDAGNFAIKEQATLTPQRAHYAQVGVSGRLHLGTTQHDLTLALDKAWRERDTARDSGTVYTLGAGNIYTGIFHQTTPPTQAKPAYLANKTRMKGISLVDSVTYRKWNVLLGVHHHAADVDAYNAAGKVTSHTHSSATTPTYAVTYRPSERVSVYGSYAAYFDAGTIVGSTYANNNAVLPPTKTKQKEIGVKYNNHGVFYSLAFFDIEQANNIDVKRGALTYKVQDGKLRHRGVELGVSGRIAPKWTTALGMAYMDATYKQAQNQAHNGVTEDGQPRWTGTWMVRYEADERFNAFGRITYTGSAPILYEKFWAPSVTVLDVGMSYKTKLGSVPTTFGLTVYNVLDKEYWLVSRDANNLYLSTPRTFALTMSMDL